MLTDEKACTYVQNKYTSWKHNSTDEKANVAEKYFWPMLVFIIKAYSDEKSYIYRPIILCDDCTLDRKSHIVLSILTRPTKTNKGRN